MKISITHFQKWVKELADDQQKIQILNNTIRQLDLTDIYSTLHSTTEYIFLSSAHGTFSRIYHMSGHKTSLINFKSILLKWNESKTNSQVIF